MDDLFKMAVLSNLTFDEILGMLADVKGKTFHEVMAQISQIDLDKIIEQIEKVISQ